jgi:hypothetical protein
MLLRAIGRLIFALSSKEIVPAGKSIAAASNCFQTGTHLDRHENNQAIFFFVMDWDVKHCRGVLVYGHKLQVTPATPRAFDHSDCPL